MDEIVSEIVVEDILSVKYPFKLFDEDIVDEDIVSVIVLSAIKLECGNSIKLSVINICSIENGLITVIPEIALLEKSSFPHFCAIL